MINLCISSYKAGTKEEEKDNEGQQQQQHHDVNEAGKGGKEVDNTEYEVSVISWGVDGGHSPSRAGSDEIAEAKVSRSSC